jgi:hypothetical protein
MLLVGSAGFARRRIDRLKFRPDFWTGQFCLFGHERAPFVGQ